MKIFDGKKESQKILNNLRKTIKKERLTPELSVFLIGKNKASEVYVKLKKSAAEYIGIKFHLFKYSKNTKQVEVIKKIKELNKDASVSGVIVQLPLPADFDANKIIASIDPKKDVDGFHKKNLQSLKLGKVGPSQMAPVLPKVIFKIFKVSVKDRPSRGKIRALVRSRLFGETLKEFFKLNGYNLEFLFLPRTIFGKEFDKLKKFAQGADILISVLGEANLIKADMVKDGVILIDAGVSKKGKKIYGDVDRKSVSSKAKFLTPVPGGVGPMTVAMLLENVCIACKNSFRDSISK